VLEVAAEGCAEDVVLSIRAELPELLQLQDCWFTTEPVGLSVLGDQTGDVSLPAEGVGLPVMWSGQTFGYLAAVPLPDRVTTAASRRIAVAMSQALGLALAAEHATI
jgi:hypothetical protein